MRQTVARLALFHQGCSGRFSRKQAGVFFDVDQQRQHAAERVEQHPVAPLDDGPAPTGLDEWNLALDRRREARLEQDR